MIKMKAVKATLALLLIGIILIGAYYATMQPGIKVEKLLPLTTPERSYVKIVDANPKLFIGDKETEITGFYTTSAPFAGNPESIENVKKYIDKAAEHNLTFVIVALSWVLMDRSSPELAPPDIWELYEEGKYEEMIEKTKPMESPEDAAELIDWEPLDELFDYAASKGVYLVPSFVYHTPTLWWFKNYKTHLQTNNAGKIVFMPSFNSPYSEKYADQVITAMVDRYKNHPALLGWDLAFGYTEENNYPGGHISRFGSLGWYDYTEFAKQRFREWLNEKYANNVSRLREAWSDSTATFENAEIPKALPDIANFDEMIKWVNGPGDARMQFYDWQLFRLEEKKRSRDHFAKLYKNLDSDHVVFGIATVPLTTFASGDTMMTDYYEYAFSPYIDVVFFCPGVSNEFWENPTYRLICYSFIKYFQNRGKAAFIKWEDWGCSDLEEIKKCAEFAKRTNSGITMWEGKTGYPAVEPLGSDTDEIMDEPTAKEIATFANIFHTTPKERLKKSEFAIIEEPMVGVFDYRIGTEELNIYSGYKGFEMLGLGASLISARLDFDVVTTNEIVKNPKILKSYKAVALVNIARMDEKLLNALIDYRNGGGGLFIVGRTGLFNAYGNKNTTYLKKLLNVSDIQEYKITQYSWSFSKEDKLLEGIEGEEINANWVNLVYLPTFDYEKEGYKVLARLDNNPKVATVGYNGKTVFWFPSLRINEGKEQIFLQNLYDFYDIHAETYFK